ncbi:hypothetical protein EXS65_01465 [Candidatus Peribacteria bacterium]|nr:hypothetical protein [Candidatus Peribacteria bacterium]
MSEKDLNHERIDSHLRVDPAAGEHHHASGHHEHMHVHAVTVTQASVQKAVKKAGIVSVGAKFDFDFQDPPHQDPPQKKSNDRRIENMQLDKKIETSEQ